MISFKTYFGPTKFIGNYTKGHDNNFNFLRFAAATLVLITHSFVLSTGRPDEEPLRNSLGTTFGTIAVDIFFVASGFLVTSSLLYRRDLRNFFAARVLRIYPALWLAVTLTVVAAGLFFTTLDRVAYLTAPLTWHYIAYNFLLIPHAIYSLPGTFLNLPWPNSVNGSLWTLPIEIRMYAALAFLWALALLVKRDPSRLLSAGCILFATFGLIVSIFFVWQHRSSTKIEPTFFFTHATLGHMFFSGATIRILKDRIPASHSLACGLLVLLLLTGIWSPLSFHITYRLFVPYLVIYIALVPGGFIRRFNALGDYSYGIYIYAFLVQQAIAFYWHGVTPIKMIVVSFPITLILAIASWHWVESRVLSLKSRLDQRRPLALNPLPPT